MCKAPNYSKMNHKCLYLSTALLLALNIKNYRCKLVERNKCRDMGNCSLTLLVDAFSSKKSSSSLLLYEQQASQKRCVLNRIQLLVIKKMKYACEHK